MAKKIRVGIVGAGWVASHRHLPSYRSHADCQIVAIYDHHIERARALADCDESPKAVSSLKGLIETCPDVVSICTPPWTHAEFAIAALEAGSHVFCEKPMAMSEEEASAMANAAEGSGRLLCVSHNFLFSRAVRKADRLLTGQAVSYALATQVTSRRRRLPTWYDELPAGLLLDECPHMLYLLSHYLGPLRLLGAQARTRAGANLPASADITLEGSDGVGHLTMVFDAPLSEWHLLPVATERVVDIDLFRDVTIGVGSDHQHRGRDVLMTSAQAFMKHASGVASSGVRYAAGRLFWGHDALIHAFVNAVQARTVSPVPLDDALAVVRLTDDILNELGVAP